MHAGAPKARGLWFNKCRVCRPAPGVQASGHFYPLSPRYASENRGKSRFSMRSLLPCDHAHEPRTGPAPIADAVGLLIAFHLETNGKTSHTTFRVRIAAPAARDWRDTTGILGSRAWVETAADNHLCIFHANSGRSESCEPLPSSFFRCRGDGEEAQLQFPINTGGAEARSAQLYRSEHRNIHTRERGAAGQC
jgi:hypothetical protein